MNKMIYTFTINKKPKAIEAETLSKAVSRIVKEYFYSFMERKINYICSNDPSAPKQEMEIFQSGLYSRTGLRPVKKVKSFTEEMEKWESEFSCGECGNDDKDEFYYDRTVANGEVWICRKCNCEELVSDQPKADNF